MTVQEWRRDRSYVISTERKRISIDVVAAFMERTGWSKGIPRATLERAIDHSLPFGVYCCQEQVGFARVVTDYATFAYLCDVFIVEEHRRQGLAKWLVDVIVEHPELQGLRRFVLVTRDKQELYRKVGFTEVGEKPAYMHRWDPDVYVRREVLAGSAGAAAP